jgi:hypothetical protein
MKSYKRIFVFMILIISFGVHFAQTEKRFYFEGGLGVGKGSTTLSGNNIKKYMHNSKEFSSYYSAKFGYLCNEDFPIYITGEITGMSHQFSKILYYDDSYYYYHYGYIWGYDSYYYYGKTFSLNSCMIAPGIMYYPFDNFQLSASAGYSFTANQTGNKNRDFYNGDGFATNYSVAYDFNRKENGLLIGINYYYSSNVLDFIQIKQKSSSFNFFVKYTMKSFTPLF